MLVTTGNKEEAEKIVCSLLEEKLIACANIIGSVSSVFQWSGKIERSEEYLVLMKSRIDLFERLLNHIESTHSYEVPEIIALPIIKGSDVYMSWLNSCLI